MKLINLMLFSEISQDIVGISVQKLFVTLSHFSEIPLNSSIIHLPAVVGKPAIDLLNSKTSFPGQPLLLLGVGIPIPEKLLPH